VATVIGVGCSTGGPPALAGLLSQLPADFPVPVLVVQHISPGFTEGLVRWLDEAVALPVRLARHAQNADPGAWFAPADAHLVLEPGFTMSLDTTTTVGPHRPSVDVLLTSLARVAGRDAVGVVLTGMGRDGAVGIAAIDAAGGLVLAQDGESSVVDGMPAAARGAGALPSGAPKDIGTLLGRLHATRSAS
jgi:two-component system, chemotaxis family, protein-glutamate methylesterase/glutaminase